MTCVKYSYSKKLLFKERRHVQPYLTEEGGYYLFDKNNIPDVFDATKHHEDLHEVDGTSLGADSVTREDRNIETGFDRKSRTKRASSNPLRNTASFILSDGLPQLLVHWVRNNSSAIVVVTRRLKSGTIDVATESNLYFSYDYGKTFQKSTLGNTISQFFSSVVDFRHILFADVERPRIITTNDIGRTLRSFPCPFKPSFISVHPSRDSYVIGYDKYKTNRALWLSTDFGQTWQNIQSSVKKAYWGNTQFKNFENVDALYVEKLEPTGKISILKSETFFLNDSREQYLISNIDEFYIRNSSLFAVQSGRNGDNDLLITLDRHSQFLLAVFPTNEPKKEFFIVDVADNQIMVLVSFGLGKTHLYISESNTVNFKLSLEDVIYSNPDGIGSTTLIKKKDAFADIHKVKGLRSVFMANTGTAELGLGRYNIRDMKTVISFDKGATWDNISAPFADSNGDITCPGSPTDKPCTLQFSQNFHNLHSLSFSTSVLTETSSPGYVFATGIVGSRVSGIGDIYFSANGGKTWKEIQKGGGYYNWADHGGIVAYVKKDVKINMLHYSIDGGHTWKDIRFYSEPIRVYALLTEPGQTSTVFTAFGLTRSNNWILAQIDMKEVFEDRICQQHDYISWSPVDDNGIPCLLGTKVSYQRRRGYNSIPCRSGNEFDRQSYVESCPCTKSDFECARGFHVDRNTQSLSCVRSSNSNSEASDIESICRTGTSYNKTRGYRKIFGDKCSGGDAESQFGPIETPCPRPTSIDMTAHIPCDNGRLIPVSLKCNRVDDCQDGTDERNCH